MILPAHDTMMSNARLLTRIASARRLRGWTQEDLARRAGVSRAEVSAVETGRAVPSTAVALALARALGKGVEALFSLADADAAPPAWAWESPGAAGRFWLAEVDGRHLRYPVEASARAGLPHDGVVAADPAASAGARLPGAPDGRVGLAASPAAVPAPWGALASRAPSAAPHAPDRTLVVAGCDPAVGLLSEALRGAGVRLLAFGRSSRRALELVEQRRVHLAGVHLGESLADNARAGAVASAGELRFVHLARWCEGLALAPGLRLETARAVLGARLRWVGRDEGSGARACMDVVLEGRRPPEGCDRTASDHHGVVETIRTGWAQAGVCVEIAAREGGLDFLPVRTAAYDLCFRAELEEDPRIQALLEAVRSTYYRRLLSDLPGYDPRDAGVLA